MGGRPGRPQIQTTHWQRRRQQKHLGHRQVWVVEERLGAPKQRRQLMMIGQTFRVEMQRM
jgi:hypothetical protein